MLIILQIIVSCVLIVLILLQERGSGLSGIFGGSMGGTPYQTRRGLERVIYWATIATGTVFAALTIINLITY